MEIFRDESSGRCRRCGHKFLNPGTDLGCAQWCSLANECLGFTPQRELASDGTESALAARLIQWVEQEFKSDPACIAHELRVFQYAKELVKNEGGDPRVVLSAALLLATSVHNTGNAENPPEQCACRSETTAKAREALKHMRLDEAAIQRVCQILESCRKGEDSDAIEFQIVCDSQSLAKLAAEQFMGTPSEWENMIRTSLRTETAKNKARGLLHT
ncbi:MAG TPA: hypothetical protein VIH42_06270 [Thermoguttaceae bacterium]